MVVKEDGTKWACQSCLKGHRVSGCTHTDRPLFFVPKKGRPVTQCQHCRVERKKRSAHVKCDCGEKHHTKERCVHLRNGEGGHGDLQGGSELGPVPEDQELEELTCCCHHGGNCTCATLKKEGGSDSEPHHPRAKPRLTTTQSDGHITTFTNGHHKPVHRNNNAAHENMPYKLPRSHTEHNNHATARRSIDSASSDRFRGSVSMPDQSAFNFATPPEMTPQSSHTMSTEHASMDEFPFSSGQDLINPSVDLFDFSQLDGTFDGFGMSVSNNDNEVTSAMPYSGPASASVSDANICWSSSDIDWTNVNAFDDSQPALTYASSNTHSEFGEHTPPEEVGSLFGNRNFMRSMQEMPTQAHQSVQSVVASGNEVSANQSANMGNRWSLPPNFWTDALGFNTGSSSNTSAESLASNSNGWGQPPTSTPAAFPNRPAATPRSTMPDPRPRPRPRAVYQKSNTLSGNPGWEQLLQQHQAGTLWAMEGVEQPAQSTNSFANMATKTTVTTPIEYSTEVTPDVSMPQRTDSEQQFLMDPESANIFGFNTNDLSNPGFFPAWPQ